LVIAVFDLVERLAEHMDANHAIGCSLIGFAFTALLIRVIWLSSPPFNTMDGKKIATWKHSLTVLTIVMTAAGSWLLSKPEDPSVAIRNAEEGFQFH
jgi:hypothetical protein